MRQSDGFFNLVLCLVAVQSLPVRYDVANVTSLTALATSNGDCLEHEHSTATAF